MSVLDNFTDIERRIVKACKAAGRVRATVSLVAVSKRQEDERIQSALEVGHRTFGENRVQEAFDHWAERREQYPDLILHLIGPLQTNKVKQAIELFDVIETIDREKLVDALAKEMEKQGKSPQCYIQVNTGDEPQKAGVSPKELPSLLAYAKEKGLSVTGLMCIPPVQEPSGLHFGFLKKLADENGLENISMGMSSDYEKAIAFGASHVRVGTALFGNRE